MKIKDFDCQAIVEEFDNVVRDKFIFESHDGKVITEMWEWVISKHMPEKEKPHKMSKQYRENFSKWKKATHEAHERKGNLPIFNLKSGRIIKEEKK